MSVLNQQESETSYISSFSSSSLEKSSFISYSVNLILTFLGGPKGMLQGKLPCTLASFI